MKVVLLKGLPASGKTTYAKTLLKRGNWKRVNKDDIRAMLDDSKWSKANEKLVLSVRDLIIVEALAAGQNVVIDDTNLHPKHEQQIRELVASFKPEFEAKCFEADLDTCIARDLQRTNSVGERVIRDMYAQFLAPPPVVIEWNNDLPTVIVCDLDGTLAHSTDRGWYDTTGFDTDILDLPVHFLLERMGLNIIFVSGRSEDGREGTEAWLRKYGYGTCSLYMRPSGDMRKDSIVKQEIYDEHIKGQYNVLFVLDDRQQVVDMWRANGLKCLQVEPGGF